MSNATPEWPSGLTVELRQILGFMCFQLGEPAHVYRAAGEFRDAAGSELKPRAEDEQAFMLHKLVGLWFAHGDGWREAAKDDLKRARGKAAARHVSAPA